MLDLDAAERDRTTRERRERQWCRENSEQRRKGEKEKSTEEKSWMSARSSMTSTGRSSLPREQPAREVNAANKKLVFEHFQFSRGALPFS